ncbi:ABC transporter permease [Microbispora sp. CA-135349]|uniref:ABC transporter permease n=1 Tax=Microbispora sp. CA-135349 TaxID=3239953 RepID=UPI003D8E9637
MSLALTHAKYQFLEGVRMPIAVIGAAFFPAAAMIFFVVPFTADDPIASTYATASMITFALMTTCLFQFGAGIADDRAQAWDPFTRTLPAGPLPRFAGRILCGLAFMVISMIPLLVIAAAATEAHITPLRFVASAGAVAVVAVVFTLMGLAIGYLLPFKAALAVAQLLFFPLAFGGGLLAAPGQSPGFVEAIAPYLPSRGAVELMWAAVGDFRVNWLSVGALGGWLALLAVVAAWAYRRDQGRRFR